MEYKLMYSTPYYYVVNAYGFDIFKSRNRTDCENKIKELEANGKQKEKS